MGARRIRKPTAATNRRKRAERRSQTARSSSKTRGHLRELREMLLPPTQPSTDKPMPETTKLAVLDRAIRRTSTSRTEPTQRRRPAAIAGRTNRYGRSGPRRPAPHRLSEHFSRGKLPMYDHPILCAVLIAIGVAWLGLSHFSANAINPIPSLIVGNIVALNGVLLAILGGRK